MMYRKLIIFALLLQTLIVAPQAKAACEVVPGEPVCPTPTTCEPTWEYTCEGTTQYDTCPPNYHSTPNGGCQENGTGGGNTRGGDAANCFGTINCAANAIDPNSYNTIYIGDSSYSNSCPPLGNAQSLAWSCIDDICAWRMTIHACCASGSEVACHEETGGTYTVLRDNSNYWACGEERDIYVSTNTNTGIVRFGPYRECGEDGCYMITEYWWQTTCTDVYDACACTPVCHSTAPSSLAVVQGASATTANVSWNVGTGGSSQRIYVDQSQTEVNNGCTTVGAVR